MRTLSPSAALNDHYGVERVQYSLLNNTEFNFLQFDLRVCIFFNASVLFNRILMSLALRKYQLDQILSALNRIESFTLYECTYQLDIVIIVYITTILLMLNTVLTCFNKLGEHNAPEHNAISGVVIVCPWSKSVFETLIRSMYIVGVPYKNVHLLWQKLPYNIFVFSFVNFLFFLTRTEDKSQTFLCS